jgi:hypothetical protein
VLDAVLVPGDQAAADLAVVRVLAVLAEHGRVAVQPSTTPVQTDDFSPSQMGDQRTRMSAACTVSYSSGQSSRSAPCSHVGQDAGGELEVDGTHLSTTPPFADMIAERSHAQGLIDLSAGDGLSGQLR